MSNLILISAIIFLLILFLYQQYQCGKTIKEILAAKLGKEQFEMVTKEPKKTKPTVPNPNPDIPLEEVPAEDLIEGLKK